MSQSSFLPNRLKSLETTSADPISDIRSAVRESYAPTASEPSLVHPVTGGGVKLRDSGTIDIMTGVDVGLRIDPGDRSVSFLGDFIRLRGAKTSIRTAALELDIPVTSISIQGESLDDKVLKTQEMFDDILDLDKRLSGIERAGSHEGAASGGGFYVHWNRIIGKPDDIGVIGPHDHDSLYYRKNEVDDLLAERSPLQHKHVKLDIEDFDHEHSQYLSKTNTTVYVPVDDYNPATKKYIDDAVAALADQEHTHEAADITTDPLHRFVTDNQILTWNAKQDPLSGDVTTHYHSSDRDWDNIINKPSAFPPSSHSHEASEITQSPNYRFVTDAEKAAWNAKQDALSGDVTSHYHSEDRKWENITGKPSAFPPSAHGHDASEIAQSANYRFVTDAEKATWNSKQDALGYTPENVANKGMPGGYASLDASGKIPFNQIPSMAATQATIHEHVFYATSGQTTFVLTEGHYEPGKNRLQVFVDGVRLNQDEIEETSPTSFTLPVMEGGEEVIASYMEVTPINMDIVMGNISIRAGATPPPNPRKNDLWLETDSD